MTNAAEWTGPVGDQWSAEWRRIDRSFADLASYLDAAIRAVAPEAGRALDLGCGAGATASALAAARPGLKIVGADLSPALVARATERADGNPHLQFEVGDAVAVARRLAPLDLLFSRHGVMFYDDPMASFTALHETASAKVPLVFSCFRAPSLNPWAAEVAKAITGQSPIPPSGYVPGPFAFADPAFVTHLLARAGWHDAVPQAIDSAYRAGEGPAAADDALDFFTRIGPAAPALRTLAGDARDAALDRLRAVVMRYGGNDAVDFPAAAWIWTACA